MSICLNTKSLSPLNLNYQMKLRVKMFVELLMNSSWGIYVSFYKDNHCTCCTFTLPVPCLFSREKRDTSLPEDQADLEKRYINNQIGNN